MLLDINSKLGLKLDILDEKISVEYVLAVKDKLTEIKEKEDLDFVYGKDKRKSSLQNILRPLVILWKNKVNIMITIKPLIEEIAFQKLIMTLLSCI